jgi:Ni,Fe-hydrogenase III component G
VREDQDIQAELNFRYAWAKDAIRAPRDRRVFLDVPAEQFQEVFDYVTHRMGFSILCAITGLDLGESLGAIYHLARPSGVMLNLSIRVPKDAPLLQTVTGTFPAADAYEREMVDLLGMQVQGLPPGPRYPLPDDWPAGQYPLRKDWKAPAEAAPAGPEEAPHA